MLQLLLLERANPRSLAFQLGAIQEHVAVLPSGANPDGLRQIRQQAASLLEPLRRLCPGEAATRLAPMDTGRVVEALRQVALEVAGLSNLLTRVFFSHVEPRVD